MTGIVYDIDWSNSTVTASNAPVYQVYFLELIFFMLLILVLFKFAQLVVPWLWAR